MIQRASRWNRTVNVIKPFFVGVLKQIPPALVSAIIGSIFGAVTALAWDAYRTSQQTKFFTIGDDTGVAYPAVLFDNAAEEGLDISFNPKELKQLGICEYTHDRGRTWTDLVYKYLKEYKTCFIVLRVGEGAIEVSPNNFSGLLTYDKAEKRFMCKCSE